MEKIENSDYRLRGQCWVLQYILFFSQTDAQVLATDIDLNESWLEHLDVRDINECEKIFEQFKPTLVLNLAALTDLEYCENNPTESWKTNALGTENVALMAKNMAAQCVKLALRVFMTVNRMLIQTLIRQIL